MCFKNQGHHDLLKTAIARSETRVCSSSEEGECSLSVQQFSKCMNAVMFLGQHANKQLQQPSKWKYIKGNYSNMTAHTHVPRRLCCPYICPLDCEREVYPR